MSERPRRVLVVDDEDGVRSVATRILQRSGYEVLTAGGGEEALALLGNEPDVDLLLTDVIMPRMSGKELATRLATAHPGVRVLYMSGYTDRLVGIDELDHLLEKPFRRETLIAAVERVLEG
jgi:DNA-binding NtrC family response regulator